MTKKVVPIKGEVDPALLAVMRPSERLYLADGSTIPSVDADAQICEDDLATYFTERSLMPGQTPLVYCAQRGQWYAWTGNVWREDSTLQVFDMIRQRNRQRATELADSAASEGAKRQAVKDLRAARNSRVVAGVERLLRADREHAVDVASLDADPMLLNTPRGTVDLQSGELVPARKEDLITKCTRASPGGSCPAWETFINDITDGDEDLAGYLQRVAGYSLTGLTQEHAFFFMYGTGANGKSTFLLMLLYILGDYAVTAPAETFMESNNERHPTELAMLRGARLVVAQEIDQGRRWNLSRIKSLTGGDPISARVMRGDFFTFDPAFKLLLAGNHKPGLRNVDEAIRRRLNLVPFKVTIPVERRNPNLVDDLKLEADGILAWMIRGCVQWRREGLSPPARVRDATASYFAAENSLGAWLDERTERDPMVDTNSTELYVDYARWMDRRGERAVSQRRLSSDLEDQGLERELRRNIAYFIGIKLREPGTTGGGS